MPPQGLKPAGDKKEKNRARNNEVNQIALFKYTAQLRKKIRIG
jgi:hypothetical protein